MTHKGKDKCWGWKEAGSEVISHKTLFYSQIPADSSAVPNTIVGVSKLE